MRADTEATLARAWVASNALAEASKTIHTIAKNAITELDLTLGKAIVSVRDMAQNGLAIRKALFAAVRNNERLAIEWDAQQQRTIDLARENLALRQAFKAIGYYAEHQEDCEAKKLGASFDGTRCTCGLETLWRMTNGLR